MSERASPRGERPRELMCVYECPACFLQVMGGLHSPGDRVPKHGGACDECGARVELIGAFTEREFFDPNFWIERDRRLGRLVEPQAPRERG